MANEFVLEEKKNSSDGKFNGTSFCFHGTLSYKRKELEEMVIANGGKIGGESLISISAPSVWIY